MNDLELLPADLQQLLQLFSSLPDVRFPELDATGLQVAVARVKERQLELLHIEAQRDAVRVALDEEQEALLRKGHRLHAYLKVFAEHDEALAVKVNALALPRLRKQPVSVPVEGAELAATPRKRGRPRKTSATDALFTEETGASASP
ncbi:MAG: hypothetical protein Q8N23_18650 [Archangium sp.]|nr:hypothetical protein [Archangium sp.]MDP3154705.1 hypothetical protein [Archangium sp.]MDP3573595.1 hypothetical protein [Archangium sp.]